MARGLFTEVDRLKINYVVQGKGKPVIMIHGWMGSNEDFPALLPFLSKHFKVIVPDLPGFGESQDMPSHKTEDYARFVLKFMDKIKLKKAYIVGNCSGASIALIAASMQPKRFEKMVAFTPIYYKKILTKKFHRIATVVKNPISKRTINWMIHTDPIITLVLRTYMKHAVGEYGEATKKKKQQAKFYAAVEFIKDLQVLDIRKEIKGLIIPTFVIYYENDAIIANKGVRGIRKYLPRVQFCVARQRGHFANPDDMVDVYSQILAFLQKK